MTSANSPSKHLHEEFRFLSFENADIASISTRSILNLERTGFKITGDRSRKNRRSSCKHNDEALECSARRTLADGCLDSTISVGKNQSQSTGSREIPNRIQDAVEKSLSRRGFSSSSRGTYNFHIGLLNHSEANKTDARSCNAAEQDQTSNQANDELWNVLMQ